MRSLPLSKLLLSFLLTLPIIGNCQGYLVRSYAKEVKLSETLSLDKPTGKVYGASIDYDYGCGPISLHFWSSHFEGMLKGRDDEGEAIRLKLDRSEGFGAMGLVLPFSGCFFINFASGYGWRQQVEELTAPLQWKLRYEIYSVPIVVGVTYAFASYLSIGIEGTYFYFTKAKWKYLEHIVLNGLTYPLKTKGSWRVEIPLTLALNLCSVSLEGVAGLIWERTDFDYGNISPFAPENHSQDDYGAFVGMRLSF